MELEKINPNPDKANANASTDVVVVLYEGVTLLDVAGPAEALNDARKFDDQAPNPAGYQLDYVVLGGGDWVNSSTGLPLKGVCQKDSPQSFHTLLIPGAPEAALIAAIGDPRVMADLRSLVGRAERLASVCTGAFLLGELGLLDGRRVTTHWAGLAELAERYPKAGVAQDRLYEQDGPIWTSAGVLSGVDMALAIIEQDMSREVAMATARQLVTFLVRHGGQSQFSAPITLQEQAVSERLGLLVAYLQERLDQPCSVADMARVVSMSERSLHRHCKTSFAMTPSQLLTELRLEHARSLLLTATRSIKTVAASTGYATASSLTKAFTERYGVAPSHYRAHFA